MILLWERGAACGSAEAHRISPNFPPKIIPAKIR